MNNNIIIPKIEDKTEIQVESFGFMIPQSSSEPVKRSYRTRERAGEIIEMPKNYAIITNMEYKNAVSLFDGGKAAMRLLKQKEGLEYRHDKVYIHGLPASLSELKDYFTKDIPEMLDLPLLRVLYSIILEINYQNLSKRKQMQREFTIYLPELFSFIGKEKVTRNETIAIITSIMKFHSLVGIINGNIMPVLLFMGEDKDKNTISFSSPYMNKVIESIFNVSIRKDKKGNPELKKNGEPKLLPSHSYLIKPSIRNERNKRAVEIVHIVVTLIEQTGKGEPHISARTIIERNTILKASLEGASCADKNKTLKRAFTKAWELLHTQTKLEEVYTNIQLPNPENPEYIPTMSRLDYVFSFKNEGKSKSDDKPED